MVTYAPILQNDWWRTLSNEIIFPKIDLRKECRYLAEPLYMFNAACADFGGERCGNALLRDAGIKVDNLFCRWL